MEVGLWQNVQKSTAISVVMMKLLLVCTFFLWDMMISVINTERDQHVVSVVMATHCHLISMIVLKQIIAPLE